METRLSQWLKQQRKKRLEFARELDTSPANVTRWCEGRPPSARWARKIVEATNGGVTIADLYSAGDAA